MRVEIWSDVVCPWCYIGKRHFEQALERFEGREDVEIVWRSFELDPGHPPRFEGDLAAALGSKYGSSREQAEAMIEGMSQRAAQVDLRYDLEHAVPVNTFDAHRLIHFAADRGLQDEAEERLFSAYMSERRDLSDCSTLAALAGEIGLDVAEAEAILAGDAYGDAVRADEREAGAIGVSGVPFFVLDRKYAISGAQPPDVILAGLRRAWDARDRVGAGADAAERSA